MGGGGGVVFLSSTKSQADPLVIYGDNLVIELLVADGDSVFALMCFYVSSIRGLAHHRHSYRSRS